MLIYRFLKNLTALAVVIFNRNVFLIDSHLVPKSGAIIFAINHPTAFSDSFMHMVFSRFDCYFLLRGDFFKVSKFVLWFMNAIRLVPVYRQRDGFSALRQNQELFELFYQLVHEKKSISIMVEGSHDYHKRLRLVQRGTAKIAFGTYEKYGDTDIKIVPIGLTYSDVAQPRGTVNIKIEHPILLTDYLELYQLNARKAENAITAEIAKRIKNCLVHVEQESDDLLVDCLLTLHRNDSQLKRFPPFSKRGDFLAREMKIAEVVNQMNPADKSILQQQTETYFDQLKTQKITDVGVAEANHNLWSHLFLLLLGLPFFLIGYLTSAPIAYLAQQFTKKRIKKKEFIYSVGMVAHMFSFLIYFSLLFLLALISWNIWWTGTVLLLPFFGYFSLLWRESFLEWNDARKFNRLPLEVKKALENNRHQIQNLWKPFW